MTSMSPTVTERARKAHATVLQAMQDPGTQRNVALAMGVSESTISRTKTEKLEDAIALLYQLGFKVVSQDMRCYPADYVQALQVMARLQMQKPPEQLSWE